MLKESFDFLLLLRVSGKVRSLSSALWSLTHLTALHLSDNSLSRIPPDIAKLHNLVYLDLSSNKIRSLPAELGNMVSLRWASPVGGVVIQVQRVCTTIQKPTLLILRMLYVYNLAGLCHFFLTLERSYYLISVLNNHMSPEEREYVTVKYKPFERESVIVGK